MKRPIVRVTQIEAFRRYLANNESSRYEITEQSVIDSITGGFAGNVYTRIGTAFHSIIETGTPRIADATDGCTITVDGHDVRFNCAQLQTALEYRSEHPGAFHEIRASKDYGRAIVTGCADMIDGLELRDIKTKFSNPSDSEYIDSCQWRFYLDIFMARTFHFDLFVFEGYKPERHQYDVRALELRRHTPAITCHRYPDMEKDNLALLNAFMDWAESRGLTSYLVGPRNH